MLYDTTMKRCSSSEYGVCLGISDAYDQQREGVH